MAIWLELHIIIQDDMAETFYRRWSKLHHAELVKEVLQDNTYWGADLYMSCLVLSKLYQISELCIDTSGVKKQLDQSKQKKKKRYKQKSDLRNEQKNK